MLTVCLFALENEIPRMDREPIRDGEKTERDSDSTG